MRLHRLRVAEGHDEPGALALGRADRSEEIGPGGALVVRRPWPGPAPRPSPGELVLLADAGLVLPPELYALAGMRALRLPPGAPGDFFESLRRLRVLGVVPRPRRELAEAERPQLPPDRRRAHRHPELLPQPLHEVDQPPAHHPVAPGLGTGLHRSRQRRALLRRQRRRLARGLAVDQPVRTFGVEAHHPVPHDLQPDPADPRRLRPAPAIADRRQRQQPPNLLRVPAGSGQPTQIITVKSPRSSIAAAMENPASFPW